MWFQLFSTQQLIVCHTPKQESENEKPLPPTPCPQNEDFVSAVSFLGSQLIFGQISRTHLFHRLVFHTKKRSHYESHEVFSGKGEYVPFGKRISSTLAHYLVKGMLLPTADKTPLLIFFIPENTRHRVLQGKLELSFCVRFSLARTEHRQGCCRCCRLYVQFLKNFT